MIIRGANHNGCVGVGHTSVVPQPQRIKALSKYPISLIAAGWSHSLAYSGTFRPLSRVVTCLSFLRRILQITKAVSSLLHLLGIIPSHPKKKTITGILWSWGSGSDGRLGLGKNNDQHAPALVRNCLNCLSSVEIIYFALFSLPTGGCSLSRASSCACRRALPFSSCHTLEKERVHLGMWRTWTGTSTHPPPNPHY